MRGLPERKGGRKPRFQGLVQGPRATQPSRTHAKQNQICRSSPPEDKHGAPILYSNTNNQPWASCKGGVCPVLHVFLGRVSVPSARTVTATLGCRYPRGEITSNKGADRGLLASFLARDCRRRIIRVIGKNCHCHWHAMGTKKKKKAASKSHGTVGLLRRLACSLAATAAHTSLRTVPCGEGRSKITIVHRVFDSIQC
jgi:hypothetical protein